MRNKYTLLKRVLSISVVLAIAVAQPSSLSTLSASPIAAQQSYQSSSSPQGSQLGNILQAKTRLVTVDVVATDSHGRPIRDLKPEDFEVNDGGRRKIEKFAFTDMSTAPAPNAGAAARPSKGSYTNQIGVDMLASPPTVILVDSLNTAMADLVQTRRHMLDLLKTLPTNTPVAVLLLGNSLRMIQNFTTDPAVLRAAIDRVGNSPSMIEQMPQDDPNGLSLLAIEANDNQENEDIQVLEDFEKETYANEMDIRVTTTLNALKAIAGYLRAYHGRKSLIWISESFPLALWPDPDFGTAQNIFKDSRTYTDQTQEAANALTDARVAVYPVDARGLDTNVIPAAQIITSVSGSASRSLAAQAGRINMARMMAQTTMDQLAETTGGKTCKNTNDLSGCVESAVNDGSSYYEIAYSPDGIKWDGSFRKISLKVNRSGVKLAYRRGYYAQDAQSAASERSPEQRLRQACQDFLPSTGIPIAAQAIPPGQPGDLAYQVTIPPRALAVVPAGDSYKLSAMLASCVFPPTGENFTMTTHDLSENMSLIRYADFHANGLRGPAHYPSEGASRVRIAVLDETSGLIGALDIPVHPQDFAGLTPAAPASPPSETPHPESLAPQNSTSITFNLPTGESAKLDWGGDKFIYAGNIEVEEAVPALFQLFYASNGFHCSNGSLTSNDPNSAAPILRLTFSNASGASSIVDLKGDQPAYSGTLPIDPSAQAFFAQFWYLVHCQDAP